MQHMTADGSKDPRGWQANFTQVKEFLDEGADMQQLEERVKNHYDGLATIGSGMDLQMLYDILYDKPVLGYPFVNNIHPMYAARMNMGDHKGFFMAGGFNPGNEEPDFVGDATRYV